MLESDRIKAVESHHGNKSQTLHRKTDMASAGSPLQKAYKPADRTALQVSPKLQRIYDRGRHETWHLQGHISWDKPHNAVQRPVHRRLRSGSGFLFPLSGKREEARIQNQAQIKRTEAGRNGLSQVEADRNGLTQVEADRSGLSQADAG